MTEPASTMLPERRGMWKKLAFSLLPAAGFVWLLQRGALPLVPDREALARVPASSYVLYVAVWTTMYLVRTSRWWLLLTPIERLPLGTVVRVGCLGLAAVVLLPFRMGEAVRPILIRREGKLSAWAATGTVGAERVLDGLSVSVLLLVSLAVARPMDPLPDRIGDLPVPASLVPGAALSAAIVFAVGSVVMGVFYLWRSWARRMTELVIGAVSLRFARWLAARVEEVAEGLGFLKHPRYAVPFVLATIAYWLLNAATFWVLADACGLGGIGFFGATATMGVVALGILVPATPGFFGAFQLAAYAGLAMYLAPDLVMKQGATFTFLGYVLPVGLSVLAGVVALLAGMVGQRKNLPPSTAPG
jgi:glycosyltransferase 2 family protein